MNRAESPAVNLARVLNNATIRKLLGGGFLLVPTRDSLPAADAQYAYQLVTIRNVPGVSAAKTYQCLADAANPPAWSWVEVASG